MPLSESFWIWTSAISTTNALIIDKHKKKKASPGMIQGWPSFWRRNWRRNWRPQLRRGVGSPEVTGNDGLHLRRSLLHRSRNQKCGLNCGEAYVPRSRPFPAVGRLSTGAPSIAVRSKSDHPTADSSVSALPGSYHICAQGPRGCLL